MKLTSSLTTVVLTCLTFATAHFEDASRPVDRWNWKGNSGSFSTSSLSVTTSHDRSTATSDGSSMFHGEESPRSHAYTSSSPRIKGRDIHVTPPTSINAGHGRNTSVFRSGTQSPGGVKPYDILPSTYMFTYPFNDYAYRRIVPDLGAYAYPYLNEIEFYNATSRSKVKLSVTCLCRQLADCMVDENHKEDVVHALLGDGSYAALDRNKAQVRGKELVIDITLWDSVGAGSDKQDLLGRALGVISVTVIAFTMLAYWY